MPRGWIAIVDDDDGVRRAIGKLLQSLGHLTYAFSSASEYLQSKHVSDTSCMITDVQMPGLSGVDLQNQLIEAGHRIPIIFITAHSDENLRRRAMKDGAIEFLAK